MNEFQSDLLRTLAEAAPVTFESLEPQEGDLPEVLLAKQLATLNTGASPATVMSTALEASKVLLAGPGRLRSLNVYNGSASEQFILIMNAATLPDNGPVQLLEVPIPIAAGSSLFLEYADPLVATTGIVVCNSSTGGFTKTIGSANCVFRARVSN